MERNITRDKLVKIARKEKIKNYSKMKKNELTSVILENKNLDELKNICKKNGVIIG